MQPLNGHRRRGPESPQDPAWYGRSRSEGKDLRNLVERFASDDMQTLRLGRDDVGTVIVAGTPGGSVTLLRPGDMVSGDIVDVDYGQILWESTDQLPASDDGYGCPALAVRQVPGNPQAIDIFQGTCLTYPSEPIGSMVGAVRWMRWQGGQMTMMGNPLPLDPSLSGGRGGFAVSGCAIGDVVDSVPGDELVVTTLAGDVYGFSLGASAINATPLFHLWVEGGVGAFNSILIEDMDLDLRCELYVAGTLGIWKWRQL